MTDREIFWSLFSRMAISVAIMVFGILVGYSIAKDNYSTIGSSPVPTNLSCYEDEVIGYDPSDPAPRSLKCVAIDDYYAAEAID